MGEITAMVFSSGFFLLLFLPILFIAYNLPIMSKSEMRWKNTVLTLGSIIFYAGGGTYVLADDSSVCMYRFLVSQSNGI